MADKTKTGVAVLMDVKRFLPGPGDIFKPFPSREKADLVAKGITADVLGYAFGYIPVVGDVVGQFVNDNIIADVRQKLTPAERDEFAAQNRVYPNGIALLRTFQRGAVAPGSRP
jgi:hypothetical protein